MDCPEQIQVGPYDYEVSFQKKIHGGGLERKTLGRTDTNRQKITLALGQGPQQERDTLLHETMHACVDMMGLVEPLGDDLEERVVTLMATALLGVLRRNPLLVEYLTD